MFLGLADDLTGAIEVAAVFADRGYLSEVVTDPALASTADVLVIDTETRHCHPSIARAKLSRLGATDRSIFKKTDSTLRGNIAAELAGLRDAHPDLPIIFVPAYPQLGRTVRNSILYVDGTPVAETAFGQDIHNPVKESNVLTVLSAGVPVAQALSLPGRHSCRPLFYICDATTESDVFDYANATADLPCIRAGTASFARAIASLWPLKPHFPRPISNTGLLVCGSLHPRSKEQTQIATAAWNTAEWQVITGAPADELADQAAACIHSFDSIIVFGGDTAFALLERINCRRLSTFGELMPGVPWSRVQAPHGEITLVTKAGGFGDPDAALSIRAKLEGKL